MAVPIFQIKGFLVHDNDRQRMAEDIRQQIRKGVVVLDREHVELLGVIGEDGVFVPCAREGTLRSQHREDANGT